MEEFYSYGIKDTEEIAAKLAKRIPSGGYIALYGNMGAGKTAFVRGLVKALCPECLGLVHSPTFAIVNEYIGNENRIYHFDLYRLSDEDDLISTGFYDYADGKSIIVTEWSELFEDSIPKDAIRVKIEATGENTRRFEIC